MAIIPIRKKMRWACDYDYTNLLDEGDLAWLKDFSEYYYGGNPHKCKRLALSDADRKESWRRNNRAETDAMNQLLIHFDDLL